MTTNMDSEEGDSASIIAFEPAVDQDSIMRSWRLDGYQLHMPLRKGCFHKFTITASYALKS